MLTLLEIKQHVEVILTFELLPTGLRLIFWLSRRVLLWS